jgi:hypothetical protein
MLRPLGAPGPPATQEQAVRVYVRLRAKRALTLGHAVCDDLGEAVITRLRAAGLLR